MAKKAAVLLAQGFEEIEAVTPIDILLRAGIEVQVVGLEPGVVKGARGLAITPEMSISDIDSKLDLVVYPGGMPGAKNLGDSPKARELAQTVFSSGGFLAAICAAPIFTLGPWGFLSGKRATCFPGMENQLPSDVIFSKEYVVIDEAIITSRGAGTAMQFSLALVSLLSGKDIAREVASRIVLDFPV